MLTALHIENIAIIDQLDVEFQKGFSVLTGETGAGKSIIIDSIQLLLGNKASKNLIRTGAEYGVVSACFCDLSKDALEILDENDLSPDDDGNITIYRKIGADGRNNARINGVSVVISLLKQLGEHLVNIHGQHDGVLLLDPRRHLGYLDEFGNIEREEYAKAYAKVKTLRDALTKAKQDELNKEARRAELSLYLEELERCDLKMGEYDDLMNRRKNLMLNADITEALNIAVNAIYDSEMPAAQQAKIALDSIVAIEKSLPQGEELSKRLAQLSAELDDIGAELGKLFDHYAGEQMDPDQIENRLDELDKIKKKYGPADEQVLACRKRYREEFDRLDQGAEYIESLEKEFIEARTVLDRCAQALSEKRKKAARKMENRLQDELAYLDMPKIQFQVLVEDRLNERGGIRYRDDGKDHVEFFLSANEGEAPRPLAKIASGGELSRIMLSMKSVLNQGFDTVIYDEVDTGVSGATAEKIGKKLQAGAGERQVFSITHLAQIAACADHHYKVSKATVDGRVQSRICLLEQDERVREIARIMGGEELSDTLLKSAKEIIINNKNKD